MTESDFPIVDLGFELAASKRKSYRDDVVSSNSALVHFLQDNGLTTRRLLEPDEVPDNNFKLMKSDLTDDGYELMKHGLEKWMTRAEDPAYDVSILERELENIRAHHT